jgi:hypothetical protein
MPSDFRIETSDTGTCDCCQPSTNTIPETYGCAERRTVFTRREQRVLLQIREASEKARSLRRQLEHLPSETAANSDERREALHQLEQLRQLRMGLEGERIAAAEERMRLLGHL